MGKNINCQFIKFENDENSNVDPNCSTDSESFVITKGFGTKNLNKTVNPSSNQPEKKVDSRKTNGIIMVDRDPYGTNEPIFSKKKHQFKPGVTVLVGCNGTGKTTMLETIKSTVKKKNIPCLSYNNLVDGGHNSRSAHLFHQNFEIAATLMMSSEGEEITINIGQTAAKIGAFVRKNRGAPEMWLLFDAIDSGLSVDNIVDIKENLFQVILEDNPDTDVYIVVSANEYEMCREQECYDVAAGKYVRFKTYESYRKFVLKSRERKDQRGKY